MWLCDYILLKYVYNKFLVYELNLDTLQKTNVLNPFFEILIGLK